MDAHKEGWCPHLSIPVESDERIACSSEVGWPLPCQQCSAQAETRRQAELEHCATESRMLKSQNRCEARALAVTTPRPCALVHPGHMEPCFDPFHHDVRVQAPVYQQDISRDYKGPIKGIWEPEPGSLERPRTLLSDDQFEFEVPSQHPAALMPGPRPTQERPYACCPPSRLQQHNLNHYNSRHHFAAGSPRDPAFLPRKTSQRRENTREALYRHHEPEPKYDPALRGLIHEISVNRSLPSVPSANMKGVQVKTISLPDECRNVFITYSVDTASDMLSFTKFLTDQGFRPAIDIFDNPIRRLDVTKWMDSFLKDKSVLIIMAISPKYKEDVEGVGGDEEHGLHTKYIHNQLQNEFIQQGCLNFRLVPVLFQNATKKHVPHWLRSTRIYTWPWDIQDLLLRLLREERYILPQQDTDLTITVRPL